MKNVLVLLHADPGQESRLQAALDAARALGGHLHGLDVTPMPMIAGDLFGAGAELAVIEQVRRHEADHRAAIELRLAREDVPWTVSGLSGDLASCIAEAAKLADLIVLNRRLEDGCPDMDGLAADVVRGGRPVLAVPEGGRGFDAAGLALVAWDGSPAAAAAMRAALPLLALAREVVLLEIGPAAGDGVPVDEAAAWLSRHGVEPELRARARRGTIEAAIMAEAEASGAAYVVIGAYGHGRLREALFGGVSRAMLRESPVPLLLAR